MTAHEIAVTILTLLNVITVIINIVFMLKMDKRDADKLLNDLEKNNLIYPVATIKAEWSEEDMKKIKEMIEEATKNKFVMKQAEGEPVQCDHTYNEMVLVDDPLYCREKLVFRCRCCNHEEIIPIEKGVVMDFILGGGKA